jgi:hypothetical protein
VIRYPPLHSDFLFRIALRNMMTVSHPPEVPDHRNPPIDPLVEILGHRSFTTIDLKRRVLDTCRHLPAFAIKPLRNLLWRRSLRHMRYVLPGVGFHPRACGSWELCLRANPSRKMVSTPLVELRESTSRGSVIIATGPSAKSFDWSDLADGRRLIWAVNGAPSMLAERGLRCDYLVVSDHRFGREGADHIALAADQGATLLFTHDAAASFAATRPEVLAKARFFIVEKVNCWYGLAALGPTELVKANENSGRPFVLPNPPVPGVGWSHDPTIGVFAGRTVTFAALQLAVWAGSRTIEVVGMDLGGGKRAYQEDRPAVSHLEKDYRQFILPAFECMAAALAGSPLRIVNHSPTCPLPARLFDWSRLVS